MKITHFFMDEPKFLSKAKLIFNEPGIENEWRVFNDQGDFSHWESPPALVGSFEELNDPKSSKILLSELISENDLVIYHYFDQRHLPFFSKLVTEICVIIQLWGGDYSAKVISPCKLIGRETYRWVVQPTSNTRHFAVDIARMYHWIKWKLDRSRSQYIKALGSAFHVGYELGPFEAEFFNLPRPRFEGFRVPYSIDINQFQPPSKGILKRRGVLLGNSATETNSHFDILESLGAHSDSIETCIIPVSYGNPAVKKVLTSRAKALLSEKSKVLVDFMPQAEYFELMQQCGFVIMNHTRQQALGNILWGLATGRTVYLNPQGVTMNALTRFGFTIRSCESIQTDGLVSITPDEQAKNFNLIDQFYPNQKNIFEQLVIIKKSWKEKA